LTHHANLADSIGIAHSQLKDYGAEVPVSRWQGVETEGHFIELVNFQFSSPIPRHLDELQSLVKPNLPWADYHFAERVGGEPLNPGREYKVWPYWREEEAGKLFKESGKFSHTYMERFWPKRAGQWLGQGGHLGVRYLWGDLDDLVDQLFQDPYTRQAYLPIFFPEDTGAVHGERVPCTLGYQFMMRRNQMDMWYFIRSCDIVHYLRDDIYMACRLLLWVLDELGDKEENLAQADQLSPWAEGWYAVKPGKLHMTICSLHAFKGDFHVR
jgi:hypothetical protein